MIRGITGDLVRDGCGLIAHQANYYGVMGGGVAYSIRRVLLSPEAYRSYQRLCVVQGHALLGTNQYLPARNGATVVNMFCQNDYADQDGALTNYGAMRRCLEDLRETAERMSAPIYLPARIGCGIAGGDWLKVKEIIYSTLDSARVPVNLVYWEREGLHGNREVDE